MIVTIVTAVEPFGQNLSLVRTAGNDKVTVANRKEDGSFRWTVGELVVYVPENTVLPQDVLESRGYWEPGAKKGMLGGSKGNRVKDRVFGRKLSASGEILDTGMLSSGLLFKVEAPNQLSRRVAPFSTAFIGNLKVGQDVSEFFDASVFNG